MRRRLSSLAILVVLVALPSLAMATLIHNEDDRSYTIKLRQGSGSVSATVKANGAVAFRCAKYPCSVSLEETTIEIRSSKDDVVIKDGKLARKAKIAKRE